MSDERCGAVPESPGELLPGGWAEATLGEVADVRLGRQRSPKNHDGNQMRPYVRAANIDWSGLRLDDVKEMNFTDSEAETYQLRMGDILLNEASGSASEVGKPALWNGEIEGCCFQNTLLRVRLGGGEPRFWLHLLRYEAMRGVFGRAARGVGMHHLGAAKLVSWPVRVPPADEQRRIADALDSRLARLDAVSHRIAQTRADVAALRKAALVDAIPEEWPTTWRATTTGKAGTVDLGRARHPDWHTGAKMRPYLRVANVFEDRIDTTSLMEMDFSEGFNKYRLLPGDILLNEGQSPHLVGRPAMYRGSPQGVAFTNSLLRFRAGADVLPGWALLVFRRHLHAGRFMREVRITTNIAHLSSARLKAVEFPVPPLDEQRRLIRTTKQRLAYADALERGLGQAMAHTSALRRALLAEGFAGRLVPQNPDDEPAEDLLKRIRAEREDAEVERKAARRAGRAKKAERAKRETLRGTAPPPSDHPLPEGEQTTLPLEFTA
ncbi:restriction endonuclease subunit S [Streptomyces sioyaensis]|uniref:restriction endonuclease subunit S n=1 Tax=Streptomyces sioyaensis TaxID=67364 RepID=UPI0037D2889A